MTDEIKEILNNTLEYLEGIDETRNTKILTTNETNILLDYITNLQEENRQTKLLKERYQLKEENYKLRNEKAIKYIENHKFNKFGDIDCGEAETIINILNGGDDNELESNSR